MSERPTRKFACRYYHDGAWWSVILHAYDEADALERCRALHVKIDGELVAMIDSDSPSDQGRCLCQHSPA
jgi:hypothetical protein